MEEERRLCYVGMTRARNRLVLTRTRERSQFGDRRLAVPSRFLSEIPPECFDRPTGGQQNRSAVLPVASARELGTDAPRARRFHPGQAVVHEQFGYGTVLRVEGAGETAKLTVSFPGRGATRLLARFAGLKPA